MLDNMKPFGYVSNSATGSQWYDKEYTRGYLEGKKDIVTPYQLGYYDAIAERVSKESKEKECDGFWYNHLYHRLPWGK